MLLAGISTGDLRERIVAGVGGAGKPVSFNQLLKIAKAKKAETEVFREALASAVDLGQIHRWPNVGRVQYFWNVSAQEKAREAVLAAAAAQALAKAGLAKAAAKRLRGFSEKAMDNVVSALVAEKLLRAVSAFTGNSKLLVRTGDSQAYFSAGRAFLEMKIRKAGFDPAAFFIANSSAHDKLTVEPGVAASLILEAVRKLEPVPGVPVSTLRLRNQLSNVGKREFDAGALELRRKQEVFLNLHADPYNIPQSEKDLLIDGGDGTYYVAIAVR